MHKDKVTGKFAIGPGPKVVMFELVLIPDERTKVGKQFTNYSQILNSNTTNFVVGTAYKISRLKINATATTVSEGELADITYTLIDAPTSWKVGLKSGEVCAFLGSIRIRLCLFFCMFARFWTP